MPTAITLRLDADAPLFFDETWPLEDLFLDMLKRGQPDSATATTQREIKPYTLSPIRRVQGKQMPATAYQWRVCLLNDALTPSFLHGLESTQTLTLDNHSLTIGGVAIEEGAYADIAHQAQAQASAGPDDERQIGLEFLTPAILQRSGLPMPLPDPPLLFHHYLEAWDTFAPRELRVNFNLLDAVAFHVAVTEHRLETRRVKLADGGTRVGLLGRVALSVMEWRKLGVEFLGHLHTLAHYADFCGTGELTVNGLGQTRYGATRVSALPRRDSSLRSE
jgi:CRISPR-associated endoribonuclease Cas6